MVMVVALLAEDFVQPSRVTVTILMHSHLALVMTPTLPNQDEQIDYVVGGAQSCHASVWASAV